MAELKRVPLGIVAISMIMFFVALGTDIFWVGKLFLNTFPSTMPIDDRTYRAFIVPDVILSLLLYFGAYGLLRLKKWGLTVTYTAMGMWLFDSLLVLGITRLARINILGPSLFFVFFALIYLWRKRNLFD